MGFGPLDWLADRTGIHPAHALGEVAKLYTGTAKKVGHFYGDMLSNPYYKTALGATLAATGVGAPLGAAIMGGTGLLGGALHEGGGLRDALTEGAKGVGYGAMAGSAGQALRSAFAPGSVAGATEAASAAPSAAASAGSGLSSGASNAALKFGPQAGLDAAEIAAPAAPAAASAGGNAFLNAAKGIGSFAASHPNAVGAGLQGVGQAFDVSGTRALARAQAQQMAAQTAAMQAEEEAKKRRAEAMLPLLRALMGNQSHAIAPNPYAG